MWIDRMLESDQEIEAIQKLLDESYLAAGDHLKTIHFEKNRMTAIEVTDHLVGGCICDVATVSPAGKPVVAPMDMFLLHGVCFFNTGPSSIRLRHLESNPNVSIARTVGAEISILIQGSANLIETADYDYLYPACIDNYGPDYDSWGLWEKPWFVVNPTKMFASRMPS